MPVNDAVQADAAMEVLADAGLVPLAVFLGRVRALLAAGEFEAAEVILRDGLSRFPQDLETVASFAVAAAGQERWPEAAARWQDTLARFPGVRAFHGAAATAYAKAGFVAQADALLEQCLAEDETSHQTRNLYALIALQTERWTLAAERWGTLMRLDPSNPLYRELRGNALWQADLARSDPGSDEDKAAAAHAAGAHAEPAAVLADAAVRDESATGQERIVSLLGRFESLGDNCEFGLVQRHFGAEPATLYRFSAITPDRMIEILDLGLAPLGDADQTVAEISGGEYIVSDRRGYFTMHTFVPAAQSDAATLLKRQQARITILKRKMLFQLERGDRMFVVKDSSARISDGTLRRLLDSLRRYGPNRLLGMRHAEPGRPSGTVERLGDDVLVGYVDTMFGSGDETTDYWSWIEVLRHADVA